MANSLQRASARRKWVYFGLIAALFTVSIFWRGKLDVPFGSAARAADPNANPPTRINRIADVLAGHSVLAQAQDLDLRELDQGDPEIAGSIARLSLIGSRGLVITGLWRAAMEKQKRNEFHEFELYVRMVTRLQPSFEQPWVFQSWNIAYNVSVENDKLGDMYFYIARGIELLAEGDRLNTKIDKRSGHQVGLPYLRSQLGFYYQNKFAVSDKVNTLRCLAQLSCIRPIDRQPDALQPPGQPVDLAAFRAFCERNPQLVRRLRTKLNCARPEDVVVFLKDNDRVPSLYKNATDLAAPEDQFPILPPKFAEGPEEYYPGRPMDDTFDMFHAARAWFAYANTVVPPPKTDEQGDPLPWASPRPGEFDPFRYRLPRAPAMIIFRQQAPRAQTYLAERLQKEGWFDESSGWDPDERAGAGTVWFARPGSAEVVLKTPANSRTEWARAWRMWNKSGEENALVLPPGRRAQLEDRAGVKGIPQALPPDMTPEEMEARGLTPQRVEALRALVYYDQNRSLTNFPYFLESTRAEMDPVTVDARKRLWEAEQAVQSADNIRAARLYVQALARWREVLRKFPQFHRPGRSDTTEEQTYEYEVALFKLLAEDAGVRARAERTAAASRALYPAIPEMARALTGAQGGETRVDDIRQAVAEDEALTRVATEAVLNIFPRMANPSEQEREVVRRVEERAAKAVGELAGLAGGPAATADPAGFKPAAARALIDTDFSWMTEFKEPPQFRDQYGYYERSAYWVSPEVRSTVRTRLGLVRRPVAPEEQPPTPVPVPPVGTTPKQ